MALPRSLMTAAILLLAGAQVASAQGIMGRGLTGSPVRGAPNLPAGRAQEPPALPGATPKPGETATGAVPLDMPPTEALFDAINRGDILVARDAVQRGADLSGHNVLGMTPLDLSIDLSRNDITFFLLSMRSQSEVAGPPPGTAIVPPVGPVGKPSRNGSRSVAHGGSGAVSASVSTRASRTTPTQVVPPPPDRFAGSNGGAPSPQAGFLGFGATPQP